jgi:Uma2 family endonuclease
MSAALQIPMTLEGFLAWERQQDERYEFDGFRPVGMVGGTIAHNVIGFNTTRALQDRLGRGPCQAFHADLKIIVAGRVRYPDVVVTCSPASVRSDIIPDPVVVFEVLSTSNSRTDRIENNEEYRATPSIRHYVMLEQEMRAATVFSRAGDNWIVQLHIGDAAIPLPEIGIELPLAEIYDGLDFPPDP